MLIARKKHRQSARHQVCFASVLRMCFFLFLCLSPSLLESASWMGPRNKASVQIHPCLQEAHPTSNIAPRWPKPTSETASKSQMDFKTTQTSKMPSKPSKQMPQQSAALGWPQVPDPWTLHKIPPQLAPQSPPQLRASHTPSSVKAFTCWECFL